MKREEEGNKREIPYSFVTEQAPLAKTISKLPLQCSNSKSSGDHTLKPLLLLHLSEELSELMAGDASDEKQFLCELPVSRCLMYTVSKKQK